MKLPPAIYTYPVVKSSSFSEWKPSFVALILNVPSATRILLRALNPCFVVLTLYVPPVTFKSLLEAMPFADESIFRVPKPLSVIFVFAKITASMSFPSSSVNSPVTFRLFVEFCIVVTYTFFALTAYTVGLFVFVIDTLSNTRCTSESAEALTITVEFFAVPVIT